MFVESAPETESAAACELVGARPPTGEEGPGGLVASMDFVKMIMDQEMSAETSGAPVLTFSANPSMLDPLTELVETREDLVSYCLRHSGDCE